MNKTCRFEKVNNNFTFVNYGTGLRRKVSGEEVDKFGNKHVTLEFLVSSVIIDGVCFKLSRNIREIDFSFSFLFFSVSICPLNTSQVARAVIIFISHETERQSH